MKKTLILWWGILASMTAAAITQPGFVRTISRPNHPSERLEGVLIRVRGNHNMVQSASTGDFSILLKELQNGDPYVLSAVMKSGYQLSEEELIGRQQAGSDRVPLELTMVSMAQLQMEKNAIAEKARAGVERYYMEQLTALESALSELRLTTEQYEQQMAALDEKLMQSQQQIEKLADRYARTDYALLDSMAGAIQMAIEQGDLDKAEQLILQKGSLANRRQRIQDMQRNLAVQSKDLKQDYYHLHTIALSRFQPDSAAYFLRLRADLDSTDAAAMLDYAQFLNEYGRDREEAFRYVQMAERHTRSGSVEKIRVLNEKAVYYQRMGQPDEAVKMLEASRNVATELYGKNHQLVAGRRVNLGALYYLQGDYKKAKKQLDEAIHIYHLPEQTDSVTEAQALNNLAGIAAAKKDWKATRRYLEQAVAMLRQCAPNNNSLPAMEFSLANVCLAMGDKASAHSHYQSALASARRILGEHNPLTLEIGKRIENLSRE